MPAISRRTAITMLGALPVLSLAAAPPRAPLRVTVVNLMPWASFNQQGQPIGALVELCAELSKASGLPLQPVMVPYGRAPHMLNSGGAELMLAIDISPGNGAAIAYVGTVDIVIFGRGDFRFRRLSELHDKTVGMLRNTGYSRELDADPRIRQHAFDSYEQGARMLQAGRLDAVMGVSQSIEFALQKPEMQAGRVSPRYVLTHGKVALFADPALDAETSAALQNACKQLRQQHLMDTLLRQHALQRR